MNDKAQGAPAPQDFDPTGLSDDELKIISGGEGGDEEDTDEDSSEEQFKAVSGEDTGEEGERPINPAADPNRKPGFVPHAALHQTRLELKAAQEQLKKFQDLQAQITQTLLAERQKKVEPEEQKEAGPPDENENPFEALRWATQKLRELEAKEAQQKQMTEQEQQIYNFRMDVAREFDESAKSEPEVSDAFQYLQAALKYEYDNVFAQTGIPYEKYQQDVITEHSMFARRNNIPIAKYVRSLATARGWSPELRAQLTKQNGKTGEKSLEAEIAKIEKVAKAQDTNVSLGKASGAGEPEVTLESLARMTGDQLEKLVEKNPKLFERLTGIS